MDFVGVLLVYGLIVAVSLLVSFWIIRAAILSALAEDRRRQAYEERRLAWKAENENTPRPTYGEGGKHWLEGDGR